MTINHRSDHMSPYLYKSKIFNCFYQNQSYVDFIRLKVYARHTLFIHKRTLHSGVCLAYYGRKYIDTGLCRKVNTLSIEKKKIVAFRQMIKISRG